MENTTDLEIRSQELKGLITPLKNLCDFLYNDNAPFKITTDVDIFLDECNYLRGCIDTAIKFHVSTLP